MTIKKSGNQKTIGHNEELENNNSNKNYCFSKRKIEDNITNFKNEKKN